MNFNPLLIDVAAAVVLAAVVVLLVSGVATVALIAVVVLAVCGITLLIDRRRRRGALPRRLRRRLP